MDKIPRNKRFDLHAARLLLEQALIGAGYDVIDDPAEPDLLQARRGGPGDATGVVVDAGGQMRLMRVRQLGAEEAAERQLAGGRAILVARRSDETLTLRMRLSGADARDFASLLAELEGI